MDPPEQDSGKLMALSAHGDATAVEAAERRVVEALLDTETLYPFDKSAHRETPLYNCGVDDPALHRAAGYLTDRLFEVFHKGARDFLPNRLPLLVSGGCGLNCEWNRRWADSDLFSDVFVPPCTNDSGSAIGTAVDAAVQLGDPCRLEWNVYAGAPFHDDVIPDPARWTTHRLNSNELAQCLARGEVVAWVQGRCEMGPRALGHRSLLASPLLARNKDVLNTIKDREWYRPIAPCCLYEDLGLWFDPPLTDPYMLYFSNLKTDALPAVTHVDGTARTQSVKGDDLPELHQLLVSFRGVSGYGVLCNTSLNFRGRGFINSLSELFGFCEFNGIREIVVNDRWYRRR